MVKPSNSAPKKMVGEMERGTSFAQILHTTRMLGMPTSPIFSMHGCAARFVPYSRSCLQPLTTPKREELIASAYRHGSKESAEHFFLSEMTAAMHQLRDRTHPAYPVTIFYAYKQSEVDEDNQEARTGWETFLGAVVRAGLSITGTWPIRTEGDNRQIGIGSNALASSLLFLSADHIADNAATATRRDFLNALKLELPQRITSTAAR